MKNRLQAIHVIIAVNVVVFIIMYLYDSSLSYTTLVDFGAKINFRIVDWKLWHLITPVFLHGSFSHLIFNSLALFYFGPLVERFLGTKNFVLSYILIGIIATMGSFMFSTVPSLGASGAIYGLLAFHVYLFTLNRERYLQIFGNSIFALIIFNVIYSFISPNIDIPGHFFGFLGGLLVFFISSPYAKKLYKRIAAVGLILIYLAFCYQFISYKGTLDYYMKKGYYLQEKGDLEGLQELQEQIQYTPQL